MNSTIIAIGDELVSGFRDETNSKWLAEKLLSIDINVLSVMVVGDNEENIIYALNQALNYKDIDYVFITGGLGPTNDDITLKSLASFLKLDLFFDEVCCVLFIRDLTEFHKFQQLKSDFVANVSHELRTPLQSIKMGLETFEYN